VRRFLNSLLAGQVVFATGWLVLPMPGGLSEWRPIGLKPETLGRLLDGNAEALLAAAGRR